MNEQDERIRVAMDRVRIWTPLNAKITTADATISTALALIAIAELLLAIKEELQEFHAFQARV